jgi:death-on-curing protein
VTRYLSLAEYWYLTEHVTGINAATLIKSSRVELADSALHAPQAGFGCSSTSTTGHGTTDRGRPLRARFMRSRSPPRVDRALHNHCESVPHACLTQRSAAVKWRYRQDRTEGANKHVKGRLTSSTAPCQIEQLRFPKLNTRVRCCPPFAVVVSLELPPEM